jgi:hypothetical protein
LRSGRLADKNPLQRGDSFLFQLSKSEKNTTSRSRRAMRPKFARTFALLKTEGAGKAGSALHPLQ